MPRCPRCHEKALPDAFVCHVYGASLPGEATGITQPLSAGMALSCPKCSAFMEIGFSASPRQTTDIWWIAGIPDPIPWSAHINGEQHIALPVTVYRCAQCGYLEAYAHPDSTP